MKSIAHGSKGKTCELMMTLSHDAYGHGAVQCTKLAVSQGVNTFGVATLKEGIAIREGATPPCKIIVLGEPMQMELVGYSAFSLGMVVSNKRAADYVCDWSKVYKGKRRLLVYVLVDTGETGIGIPAVEAVVKCVTQLNKRQRAVKFCGLMTHNLDDTHHGTTEGTYPQVKLDTLFECVRRLKAKGIKCPEVHFQITPQIMHEIEAKCNTNEFYEMISDVDGNRSTKIIARCGPQAFGFSSPQQDLTVRKCFTLKGEIRSIRYVERGKWIGLGEGFQAPVNSLVAIVAVGYADGFPHLEANARGSAHVRIKGETYAIIGEICSDHLMIHMGSDKQQYDISIGDRAILFGPTHEDEENLSIDKLARIAGMNPLHILLGVSNAGKVSRHYKSTGLTRRNTFTGTDGSGNVGKKSKKRQAK